RLFSKLASEEQVLEAHGAKNRSVLFVREDSSTRATPQLPSKVAFPKKYIYEHPNWPEFRWNNETVLEALTKTYHKHGSLMGRMESVGMSLKKEATLNALTSDVIKSSEIEGEILDIEQVRSSVAQRINATILNPRAPKAKIDAIVKMMTDATQNFDSPLTIKRLFHWHSSLFLKNPESIIVGNWRDDKRGRMQVISGIIGRSKIHFEAPKAEVLPYEMARFIKWLTDSDLDYIIKSAIAHLWFVTLHPFDDGNGRIARAISDMYLARLENSSSRFYSMSSQIMKDRKNYYDILEKTQKGDLDITEWIIWFISCLSRAIDNSDELFSNVMTKTTFWNINSGIELNQRQIQMINIMIDEELTDITSSKYAQLAKCSQDTAHRDIIDLINKNILSMQNSGGRSTSYRIIF
ncbi:MAG: hypothetical protein RLZZ59_108, partial [Pseudomonadota bacterium]